METIRVNMTPCEDIKTIHASQNDNEAREWGFELHNNGELIDTSDVKEQLVFKAYKGGTEQLLPENTSTPTTSPFLGDIRYPQGLLADQEFLYRQSPAEEDGLAKITDIKGNTLVWNQILNVNIASQFITLENGIISLSGTPTGAIRLMSNSISHISGHKYLFREVTLANPNNISFTIGAGSGSPWLSTAGVIGDHSAIYTSTYSTYLSLYDIANKTLDGIKFTCQIFDLTQMFGSGNEPTSVSDFTSLFPKPYYDYNQGTLLSFNGNGIKTVGFNQWDEEWETGAISGLNGNPYADSSRIRSKNYISVFPNMAYYIKAPRAFNYAWYDGNKQYISGDNSASPNYVRTSPNGAQYLKFSTTGTTYNNDICINISSSRNGEYEPYTSSTLSLPISTYFSNGMKSAGNVYDELTESKAITRIGSITVNGSEAWVKSASYQGNYYVLGLLSNVKYPNPTAVSNRLSHVYNTTQLSANDLCFMFDGSANFLNVNIKNTSMTTLDQFKAWLQANPVTIYYELTTPTEITFTTASLVTENGEIPLSNEDGVLVGKCNSDVSADAGFIEGKIKLSDEDGDVYSNKIQIHVERSPQ